MCSRWHHRGISRIKAEEKLLAKGKNGSFLIRDSESLAGASTLAVLKDGLVKQYRIVPDENNHLYIQAEDSVEVKRFPTLTALVDSYIQKGDNNGLVCALRYPVPNIQAMDERDSDDDDEDRAPSLGGGTYMQPLPALLNQPASSSPSTLHPALSSTPSSGHVHNSLALPTSPPVSSRAKSPVSDKDMLQAVPPSPGQGAGTLHSVAAQKMHARTVAQYFEERLQKLDLSNCDGAFIQSLQKYVNDHVTEDARDAMTSGEDCARHLDTLVSQAFADVQKAADAFVYKLDILRELFAPLKNEKLSRKLEPFRPQMRKITSQESIDTFIEKLQDLKTPVNSLHSKATSKFTHLHETGIGLTAKTDVMPQRPRKPSVPKDIPDITYQVRKMRHGQKNEMPLTVSVMKGNIIAAKPGATKLTETNLFQHDKVVQLVKNTSHARQLELHVQGQRPHTYEFESARKRESFCTMVQRMKVQHSAANTLETLTLFVGTWNLGDVGLTNPAELKTWLECTGTGKCRERALRNELCDMYVIGVQESARMSDDKLARRIREVFKLMGEDDMHHVASKSLWSIGLVVFVKEEHKDKVFYTETSSEATGIANTLGNKGAVGVSLSVNGTSFCFVCAHLAARQDASRNEKRNQNFRDIVSGLGLGQKRQNSHVDLTHRFHHVFFLGDLNYRVDDKDYKPILESIRRDDYHHLMAKDQLHITRMEGKCFVGFKEEEITFPPTYRMKRGEKREYVVEKMKKTGIRINTPSWCDRVLWKSYPDLYIANDAYGSVEEITTSDHKPVFASFRVGIAPVGQRIKDINSNSDSGPETPIVFKRIWAKVKMSSTEALTVEIHSPCFKKFGGSKKSKKYRNYEAGYCSPEWEQHDIDEVEPDIGDAEFLEQQHFLLLVKSEDNMESYGEAVISLKDKCTSSPSSFRAALTHRGELTGEIGGSLSMPSLPAAVGARRPKNYELVYMDTEVYGTLARPQPSPPASASRPLTAEIYSEAIEGAERTKIARSQMSPMDPAAELYEDVSQVEPSRKDSRKSAPEPLRNRKIEAFEPTTLPHKPKVSATQQKTSETKPVKQSRDPAKNKQGRGYMNVSTPGLAVPSPVRNTESTETKLKLQTHQAKGNRSSPADPPPPKFCGKTGGKSSPVIPDKTGYCNKDVGGGAVGGVEHDDRPPKAANRFPATISTQFSLEENPVYGCTETADSSKPTPQVHEEEYEILETPSSVESWLRGLDLSQFKDAFLDNGWDNVQFMKMDQQDLRDIGIKDETHIARILQSLRQISRSIRH